MTRSVGVRCLAAAAAAAVAGAALAPTAASASGAGSFTSNPQALNAKKTIFPGDWIALGYALSVSNGAHPTATLYLRSVVANLPVSCSKHGGVSAVVPIQLADSQVVIPSGDTGAYPSQQSSSADSYQGSAALPAACGSGNAMWVVKGSQGAMTYSGNILSDDTADGVALQFHAVDPNSSNSNSGNGGGGSNIDCSSQQQNSGAACTGDWSSPVVVNAGAYGPAGSSGGGGGGSGGGTGGTGSGGGGGTGGTGSGGTGTGGTGTGGTGTGGTGTGGTGGTGTGGTGTGTGGTGTGGTGTGTGGTGAAQPPAGTGTSDGVRPGTTPHGSSNGLATTAGSSSTPAAGVNLPGGAVEGINTGTVGTLKPLVVETLPTSPIQSVINAILGPVPVLIPTVGDAISHVSSALPWNWFLLLAAVDGLLIMAIVIRRRRAAQTA